MVCHVVEYAVADRDIAWLLTHQLARGQHAPLGVQQAIISGLPQDLASLVEPGLKLLQQVAPRLPLLRLELRAARRIDVQLVHVHHHVEPRRDGGNNRCQRTEWHRLLMRLPVVLSLRDAFQRLADPNRLAIKFSQQQFGDLHGAFSLTPILDAPCWTIGFRKQFRTPSSGALPVVAPRTCVHQSLNPTDVGVRSTRALTLTSGVMRDREDGRRWSLKRAAQRAADGTVEVTLFA